MLKPIQVKHKEYSYFQGRTKQETKLYNNTGAAKIMNFEDFVNLYEMK